MSGTFLDMQIRPAAVIAARRTAGLSQDELARAMGANEKTIRNIESGRVRRPHPRTLRSLADVLGVEVAEIAVPDEVAQTEAVA